MNGVVFQTSTMMTEIIDRSGFAVHASGCEIRPIFISASFTMPNWSLSIQLHIFADTMVGTAHGISTAVRTRPRPGNDALSTSAMTIPKMVSRVTDTTVNHTVFHTARHHSGSTSRPLHLSS